MLYFGIKDNEYGSVIYIYFYLDGIMYTTLSAYFEAVIHVSFTHLYEQNCKYRQKYPPIAIKVGR